MDLTIKAGDYMLNVRVAAIIEHNGKVLFHKNIKADKHYCLVGGRIEAGEDSKKALEREIEEELGKKIEIKEFAGLIENFFEYEGSKYHELYLIYRAEFENEEDRKIEETMKNQEGKDYLEYHWLSKDEIKESFILPLALKDVINSEKYPIHKIEKDLK